MIRDVVSKADDGCLVDSFGLAVCLWVMPLSCQMLIVEYCAHCREELAYEVGSIIGQQVHLYAVQEVLVIHKLICGMYDCRF